MAAVRLGTSPADAILISSNDEFDDLDGQSDTSFEALDGLTRKKTSRITGIGMFLDLEFLGSPIC